MATLQTDPVTLPSPARIPAPAPPPVTTPAPGETPGRLTSLDAYRGFIMLTMASSGFAFARVACNLYLSGDDFPARPCHQGDEDADVDAGVDEADRAVREQSAGHAGVEGVHVLGVRAIDGDRTGDRRRRRIVAGDVDVAGGGGPGAIHRGQVASA